jgi:lysozyme
MKLLKEGINILHEFEALRLEAYLCPAGVPTIGWGNTYYENGAKVKLGDVITKKRADELFANIVDYFSREVLKSLKVKLNDYQFSALVSFAYNVGIRAFRNSTLLRLVNANPNDAGIAHQFKRWNKSRGRVLRGLTRRRKAEIELYFSK